MKCLMFYKDKFLRNLLLFNKHLTFYDLIEKIDKKMLVIQSKIIKYVSLEIQHKLFLKVFKIFR